MKHFKKIILLVLLLPLFLCGCKNENSTPIIQNLDYSENVTSFLNADQGFYRTKTVTITQNSVEDFTYIIKDNFQLYHLRMDISAFSSKVNGGSDLPLTQVVLNEIENGLKVFEQNNKNVIIRFAYDPGFDGNANCEPSENVMLNHIEQICSVLNKFPALITAVEVGLIGPWGEMHTSSIISTGVISRVVDKFLKNTTELAILVRTPKMIYDYLGITIDEIDSYEIPQASPAYRLGVFNDGYLGSDSDLGTYSDREKEIEFISKQTNHLPFGGEVTRPQSSLHDIDICLPEMEKINLSYLNYEWNDAITQQKWMEQKYTASSGNRQNFFNKSAYEFISSHMGYRFILNNSSFTLEKELLTISLDITNVGFGSLNKTKLLDVIFVDSLNNVETFSCGTFNELLTCKKQVNISSLTSGLYNVYFKAYSLTSENEKGYELRLANNLFNENLKANLIPLFIFTC